MKEKFFFISLISILFSCREQYEKASVEIETFKYLTHTSAIAICNVTDNGNDGVTEKGVCWSEKPHPTLSDHFAWSWRQDTGRYESPLYNLKPNTLYYIRAYANNIEGTSYSAEMQLRTVNPDYLTDPRDNRKYVVVKIGTQEWMAENLKYYTAEGSWYYNNDSLKYAEYGRLYSWEQACRVCPPGWHLPGEEEWLTLEEYAGFPVKDYLIHSEIGTSQAGKLKEVWTLHWSMKRDSTTNEFGFTAIPSGYYSKSENLFDSLGERCFFWSVNSHNEEKAWYRSYRSHYHTVTRGYLAKSSGMVVRCIRN